MLPMKLPACGKLSSLSPMLPSAPPPEANDLAGLRAENERLRKQADMGDALMFRTMADCAPVMIWVSDTEGLCFFFNAPWFAFTGKSMSEERGNGWAEGVHPDDKQRCMDIYVAHFNARKPFQMVYRLRRHDGEYRYLLDNGVPRWGPSGLFEGFIGSCIDVTDQKRLEDELVAAKNSAEKAARAQVDFLALMSHEIRTPLAAIVGMSELVERSTQPAEKSDYLRTITQASRHLHLLVSDILDVAKLEQGGMVLWDGPCNVVSATRDVISLLLPEAQSKGLTMELSCTLAPSEGECTGDEVRWKQLVMNLVSNAIKFTAGGRVDVGLSKSDGVFTLSVADTGCGIPDHYQKKLFSAFSQADFGYARTHGGSGLGLFISSLIVKAGKGSIHVKENAPQGTIFTVTLPCKPPPVRAVLPPEVSPPRLGEYHVLLVEDNVVNQRVITKMLATFNITPDLATNGIEGLDMARKKQYDMVLMDCQMPQMDGFTATQHIRELPEYQRTPIVALTALAIPGDRERCLGAGMNDVLTKPFTRIQLSTLLERFLFKATARGSSS